MALADLRPKLTYEDYVLFPDDGQRHEILGGEHYVTPAPARKHQRTSMRLGSRLHVFVDDRHLGEILAAPFDVLLSPHDVVQPDLIFVSNERAAILTDRNAKGAPNLVIEIFSPRTRRMDEGIKLDRYERLGVDEAWMLDPDLKTAKIYRRDRRDGSRFASIAELSPAAGDVLTTPLLPGLAIPLADVFA
jgi:Uma2 family endonuclease